MAIPRQLAVVGIAAVSIISIPFIASQWSDAMQWEPSDFLAAGTLLAGVGASYVLLASYMDNAVQKAVLAAVLAVGLLSVWMELAAGVFGVPFAGN
ncbi:hypothetical protein [Pseudoduganella violaceinigra]|uniref:hypothetical protein n=1 Tax=Pseudoduganella violaceinigra TaxID=246602 RepID=UPI00041BA2ED|nr:hypothetical protein [Pseudoduganella violaceinigra]